MNRFICIHGHFYQPPRENPWLESIELQESAYPYHDWNDRITFECFAANAHARILDANNRIRDIVNNYARISFNFGPTLLSWMERHTPDVYESILEADRLSIESFSGHGSALAQAYNHSILPLATPAQKRLQIMWGLRDFEHRFGRFPEGMWLPETAVDLATLEVLAEAGIRFTILAPHQAARVRKHGSRNWRTVDAGSLNGSRPYTLELPSGKEIFLFFYDGPISRSVAFEKLLSDGGRFADRLLSRFDDEEDLPQLVHIATDGETYGHHHRFGEMALAYALRHIESNELAKTTNYGEFLALSPPEWQVEIHENTSWSCAHGIGRWRSDCGCHSGSHPDWNQAWRQPLRKSLDALAADLDKLYASRAEAFLLSPQNALEEYIEVVLDRSPRVLERFLSRHSREPLSQENQVTVLKLLEMQRHAALMFTSCGWFFDEISGIETVQILQYAGRSLQLARDLSDNDLEEPFLTTLSAAKSNLTPPRDGRQIYREYVGDCIVALADVAAHYALSSLFEDYESSDRLFCYQLERRDYRTWQTGTARLATCRLHLKSDITLESTTLTFAVLHAGDQNLTGGVGNGKDDEAFQGFVAQLEALFKRADLLNAVRHIDHYYEGALYSLDSLFRDEQKKIVRIILNERLEEVEASLFEIYERHSSLLLYLENLGLALPSAFEMTAEFVLNTRLKEALKAPELDTDFIRRSTAEAKRKKVPLNLEGLGYLLEEALGKLAESCLLGGRSLESLAKLQAAADLVQSGSLPVDLWKVQNLYYQQLHEIRNGEVDSARSLGPDGWLTGFLALGKKLQINVEEDAVSG